MSNDKPKQKSSRRICPKCSQPSKCDLDMGLAICWCENLRTMRGEDLEKKCLCGSCLVESVLGKPEV